MRHRRYLARVPAALLRHVAADLVGTRRAVPLVDALDLAALRARVESRLAASQLTTLTAHAAQLAWSVAVLAGVIVVEVIRKGATP